MSGDLLTDAQLTTIADHVEQARGRVNDPQTYNARDYLARDTESLLAHIAAQERRFAALNARHALPCPKCGHQRVPE